MGLRRGRAFWPGKHPAEPGSPKSNAADFAVIVCRLAGPLTDRPDAGPLGLRGGFKCQGDEMGSEIRTGPIPTPLQTSCGSARMPEGVGDTP